MTTCTVSIDPLTLSEGQVTPPLGVEKLSPRFNFFDNMFSCIRRADEGNNSINLSNIETIVFLKVSRFYLFYVQ